MYIWHFLYSLYCVCTKISFYLLIYLSCLLLHLAVALFYPVILNPLFMFQGHQRGETDTLAQMTESEVTTFHSGRPSSIYPSHRWTLSTQTLPHSLAFQWNAQIRLHSDQLCTHAGFRVHKFTPLNTLPWLPLVGTVWQPCRQLWTVSYEIT